MFLGKLEVEREEMGLLAYLCYAAEVFHIFSVLASS
mgnify:CR=1 FL=1